jgi:uncharacterized membrane protein YraQ (UPF0718 family)
MSGGRSAYSRRENAHAVDAAAWYRRLLAGFILFLALTLLTLLDFRRGFLFAAYPARTLVYAFHPLHLAMLTAGLAGMYGCYRRLNALEGRLHDTGQHLKALTFTTLALLVIDLLAYRGIPAARSIASGDIGLDWLNAFGVVAWWKPIAQATSYLLNVWHAAMLGILISGLALTILPVYFQPYFVRAGFVGSLVGALFALPQPFCSCCSSAVAPSLARRGASTNFLLSFVVGAPMLNITTIVLAVALLPAPFAITRIVAGIVVTVLVTYLVAGVADRWDGHAAASERTAPRDGWVQRIERTYLRLFDLDTIAGGRAAPKTPSQLFARWLYASARIALVLAPTIWVWSVIASALFRAFPPAFGNNLPSVVLAAVGGAFFMISTWSEIPLALQLIQSGFNGPAATLLVVLPAISLPCVMLLGGSLRRFRLVGLLSVAVILAGIAAGAIFL